MADEDWQAGDKILDSCAGVVGLIAGRCGRRKPPGPLSESLSPPSYVGSADPSLIWEMLIGGIVILLFPCGDRTFGSSRRCARP